MQQEILLQYKTCTAKLIISWIKETNKILHGICSLCLFVAILAESQNDFAHLESRGCKNLNITHLDLLVFLLRNALLSLLEVEAGQVKHELLSFPLIIVVKKITKPKKMATFQDEDGGKLELTWTSMSGRC